MSGCARECVRGPRGHDFVYGGKDFTEEVMWTITFCKEAKQKEKWPIIKTK